MLVKRTLLLDFRQSFIDIYDSIWLTFSKAVHHHNSQMTVHIICQIKCSVLITQLKVKLHVTLQCDAKLF